MNNQRKIYYLSCIFSLSFFGLISVARAQTEFDSIDQSYSQSGLDSSDYSYPQSDTSYADFWGSQDLTSPDYSNSGNVSPDPSQNYDFVGSEPSMSDPNQGPQVPTEGADCFSICQANGGNQTECASECNMTGLDTTQETNSCDPSSSCMFWNCCKSTPETKAEPTAEQRQAASQAQLSKTSADANLQNAKNNYNAANAQLSTCGNDCAAAKAAADKAQQELLAAQAEAERKNQEYIDAMAAINGGGGSGSGGGSGLNIIANGAMGPVVDQGKYYTSPGGYRSGGTTGLPGNYYTTGSVNGIAGQKCGVGFSEIGGICFPMNTGLANPQGGILQILSNLFQWLMFLFTTLAILAFVFSGIQYFISAADEDQAKAAKKNATNAIIGIIVGLSGFIIIKAISAALAGQGYFF